MENWRSSSVWLLQFECFPDFGAPTHLGLHLFTFTSQQRLKVWSGAEHIRKLEWPSQCNEDSLLLDERGKLPPINCHQALQVVIYSRRPDTSGTSCCENSARTL